MSIRNQLDDRLDTLPKELREPPVAFAAASFVAPLLIVLLALFAGQTDASSPLYTLAAIVFVGAVCGFMLTTYRRLKIQRAQNAQREAERARQRMARRAPAVRR
jgi:uncharacterized membrane-anchored protein YitT (DUF2179 family)